MHDATPPGSDTESVGSTAAPGPAVVECVSTCSCFTDRQDAFLGPVNYRNLAVFGQAAPQD